jgi:hypothetical protein
MEFPDRGASHINLAVPFVDMEFATLKKYKHKNDRNIPSNKHKCFET